VRATLLRLGVLNPLTLHEVRSGTQVLDWIVPPEWNVRDAYIKNSRGERIVDFRASNLHVLNYSVPVHRTVSLAELRRHCFTLPDHPDWIPYRTSYYKEAWGFCLPHRLLESLPEGEYEVRIDATLAPGYLTYGEVVIPGASADEVLFSCHICHPSLANDNLSAVAVARSSRAICATNDGPRTTRTGSSSSRVRSARSPGWRVMRGWCRGSSTGWCSPAWGFRVPALQAQPA